MRSKRSNCLLTIEPAIRGGSLALFRGGKMIDERCGDADVSRAEDLLPQIAEMIGSNGLELSDLDSIAVSTGPGSFTGIRIGIATVLGLRRSLGVECFGISVLAAIAASANAERSAAVVPIGRNDVAWQIYEGTSAVTEAVSGTIENFLAALSGRADVAPVFHKYLLDYYAEPIRESFGGLSTLNVCECPASAIGKFALSHLSARLSLEPFYLQDPRHRRRYR